jgi:uncharacterized membrane protein YgcG
LEWTLRRSGAMPYFIALLTTVGAVMATVTVYFVFGPLQAFLVLVLYVGFQVMSSVTGSRGRNGVGYRDNRGVGYGDSSGGYGDSDGGGGDGGGGDGGGGY